MYQPQSINCAEYLVKNKVIQDDDPFTSEPDVRSINLKSPFDEDDWAIEKGAWRTAFESLCARFPAITRAEVNIWVGSEKEAIQAEYSLGTVDERYTRYWREGKKGEPKRSDKWLFSRSPVPGKEAEWKQRMAFVEWFRHRLIYTGSQQDWRPIGLIRPMSGYDPKKGYLYAEYSVFCEELNFPKMGQRSFLRDLYLLIQHLGMGQSCILQSDGTVFHIEEHLLIGWKTKKTLTSKGQVRDLIGYMRDNKLFYPETIKAMGTHALLVGVPGGRIQGPEAFCWPAEPRREDGWD